MKKGMQLVVLGYIRLYVLMVVIYCYLERKNYKVLKLHDISNVSYFERSAFLF